MRALSLPLIPWCCLQMMTNISHQLDLPLTSQALDKMIDELMDMNVEENPMEFDDFWKWFHNAFEGTKEAEEQPDDVLLELESLVEFGAGPVGGRV